MTTIDVTKTNQAFLARFCDDEKKLETSSRGSPFLEGVLKAWLLEPEVQPQRTSWPSLQAWWTASLPSPT
eukprot:s4209_g8.t1